jgi:pyrroline-5-carboxylate reductase
MPNTPALVGNGVTGLAAAQSASREAVSAAIALFEKVGSVIEVSENQINSLSAISGSGPAWVFYFIEQWEAIAQQEGFTKEQAEVLVRETFAGSLKLLSKSDETPSQLRKKVTSPGGTTERIIATFDEASLKSIFEAGLRAAVARAEEIAKG